MKGVASTKKFVSFYAFILLLALDRATKYWALSCITPISGGEGRFFLSLGLYFNRGISFSLLEEYANLGLSVALIGSAALCLICVKVKKIRSMRGMPLLYAGAVGNLIDRLMYGYVVDWLYIGGYINLADVWLIFGCILFLAESVSIARIRQNIG
ncbi:MAG: signal peptidase II [Synergistaceae bacterium]|nr:signal peptidase II [Synergistaceae bacterium]